MCFVLELLHLFCTSNSSSTLYDLILLLTLSATICVCTMAVIYLFCHSEHEMYHSVVIKRIPWQIAYGHPALFGYNHGHIDTYHPQPVHPCLAMALATSSFGFIWLQLASALASFGFSRLWLTTFTTLHKHTPNLVFGKF